MSTFKITIQRKTDARWLVVVEQYQWGDFLSIRSEGTLALQDDFRTELLGMEYDPQAYGMILGQALFHGSIRDALMQARARSVERIRVLLVVEAPELKPLRWERLCAPVRQGSGWRLMA